MSIDRSSDPPWEPPRTDVDFDHAAATAAIEACRHGARVVRQVGELRVRTGAVAIEYWGGVFADLFEVRHGEILDHHVMIEEMLLTLAGRVEMSIDAALTEQHRRERLREDWEDERRANELRSEAATKETS